MPFVSFVVNRLHPDPAEAGPLAPRGAPRPAVAADLAERLLSIYQDQRKVAARERRAGAPGGDTAEPLVLVPELEADVHDLRGLVEVGSLMLPAEGAAVSAALASRGRGRTT
jgi:hypothetical protein